MTKALFGAGCFWGIEKYFQKINGVLKTKVGYSGGHYTNPSYQDVCQGTTGHAEVIQIDYDPNIIISIDSSKASERYLFNLSQEIKKELELIPAIFEVEMVGARQEQLEAILNRSQIENYNISFAEMLKDKLR